jgi:hypothetical protein
MVYKHCVPFILWELGISVGPTLRFGPPPNASHLVVRSETKNLAKHQPYKKYYILR